MSIPKVSIIVPVYNAGEYFKICIESLIHQTLAEIEILLILDKPTDGSDRVAAKYAEADSRIKLIYNKENLHTGFSRNVGIQHATGEYIGFADHDDYCEAAMFERLYQTAKAENADVVISNFYDENPISQSHYAFPKGLDAAEFQHNAFLALISADYSIRNSESFNNMNVIWNQIYRRGFILENNLTFLDNRVYTMEDMFFSIKVYHFARKVAYLPVTYYHHVNTSVNTYDNYDYRSIGKVLPLLIEISKFLKERSIYDKYSNEFAICTLKRLYAAFRNELKFKKLSTMRMFFVTIRSNKEIQSILLLFKQNNQLLKRFAITKKLFYKLIINR
ncbi:MAG: glycosyltransferase [Paludibacter sp.]|nr:glycosyltransferase [Paludibacter sp.]